MSTRTTLTKSLHTVTVVRNVANQLINEHEARAWMSARDLTDLALTALGFNHTHFARDDATVVKCAEAVLKLQHERRRTAPLPRVLGHDDGRHQPERFGADL